MVTTALDRVFYFQSFEQTMGFYWSYKCTSFLYTLGRSNAEPVGVLVYIES